MYLLKFFSRDICEVLAYSFEGCINQSVCSKRLKRVNSYWYTNKDERVNAKTIVL